MKGIFIIFITIITLIIASTWDRFTLIKNTAHFILDPTFGALIRWNIFVGLLTIIFIINLIITIIHKYATDQKALLELREKNKEIQGKMKEAQKNQDQQKIKELSKESFVHMREQMLHSFQSIGYTAIPLILFFRWFGDFFGNVGNPKIFIVMGWFGTYVIFSIIFSTLIRKILKVP